MGRTFSFSLPNLRLLILKAVGNFSAANVPRLAAAFSFYAVLSLAPILVLAVVFASLYYGQDVAQKNVMHEIRAMLGRPAAELLQDIMQRSRKGAGTATALSAVVAIYGASNLFSQLSDTINTMWGTKVVGNAIRNLVISKIFSILITLVVGALIIVWLILDSWALYATHHQGAGKFYPVLSFLVAVVFLSGTFGVSFKTLPRGRVAWGDVWIPAVFTAVGFAISKYLLGLYFAMSGISSAYGSAGALVVILLWIYYTSQIYFFGVELLHSYTVEFGSERNRAPDGTVYS